MEAFKPTTASGVYYPKTEEQHRHVAEWVAAHVPGGLDVVPPFYGIAVIRDGQALAGAVYHGWQKYPEGVGEITFAARSPRWATRQAVGSVLGYAFNVLKLRCLLAVSRADNKAVLKLNDGIGFKRVGLIPCLYPDSDAVLHAMSNRWFKRSKWSG